METNWHILNADNPLYEKLADIEKTCGICKHWVPVEAPHYMDKNEVCGKCSTFNTVEKENTPHCDIWKTVSL